MTKIDEWQKKYDLAVRYYEHYGNLLIHRNFKTNNGIAYDENGINLGKWLHTQRFLFSKNKLDKNKQELLEKIGMVFVLFDRNLEWDKKYNLAKKYYEHHGNLDIPQNFKTKNGIDYDDEGISLGRWINTQRRFYKQKKLSQNAILQLAKIGMIYDQWDTNFQKKYDLAKIYYEYYGNLDIPQNFKTKNGIDYDEDGVSLDEWLNYWKKLFNQNRLKEERKVLLEQIGFGLNTKENNFYKKYELAKAYYEHYGNLLLPSNFKTKNGIEYDEEGISLSSWIATLRAKYKQNQLSNEIIEQLNLIGMIWEIRRNRKKIYLVCREYGINVRLNRLVLSYIPYGELVGKINFLLQNGMKITEDDIMHEIFTMSDINMKVKYGMDTKEIINKYYTPETVKKK